MTAYLALSYIAVAINPPGWPAEQVKQMLSIICKCCLAHAVCYHFFPVDLIISSPSNTQWAGGKIQETHTHTHFSTQEGPLDCDSERSVFYRCNEEPAGAKRRLAPRQNRLGCSNRSTQLGHFHRRLNILSHSVVNHTQTQNICAYRKQLLTCSLTWFSITISASYGVFLFLSFFVKIVNPMSCVYEGEFVITYEALKKLWGWASAWLQLIFTSQ